MSASPDEKRAWAGAALAAGLAVLALVLGTLVDTIGVKTSGRAFVIYPLRVAALGGLVAAALATAFQCARSGLDASRLWRALSGALLVGATVACLELAFMFVPRSHGISFAYAAKVWFFYHWRPTNALGYRDPEVRASPRKQVLVVGDSFVAGQGIMKRQRFSDILRERLRGAYDVHNLGVNNADTRAELANVKAFPLAPDVVVLSYLGNDIELAAKELRPAPPLFRPYADLGSLSAWLVKSSFVANFLYWSFPRAEAKPYLDYLLAAYSDPEVLRLHLRDLAEVARYCRSRSARLIVVVFPFVNDLEASRVFVAPIRAFFERQGVPVVDASELAAPLSFRERAVSAHDAHPSALLNKLVADSLEPMIVSAGAAR